jgi:hypothetical protein
MKVSNRVIEKARHYLSADTSEELERMIVAIASHSNTNDLASSVDDVLVWSPLVDELTCETLLENIGYGEKDKEMRVYVINTHDERVEDIHDIFSLTDKEFMFEAEEQGRVYTLEGFQRAFNEFHINTEIDIIRFIEVSI